MAAAPDQRRWVGWATLVLLAVLPWSGNHAIAATPSPTGDIGRCQSNVRNLLALAPVVRRSDEKIARLLDARHYRQAVFALRSAVSRHADAWAGYTLGNLYAAGLAVPRSPDSAFRWYLWSAKRGDRFAQQQVANAYLDGEGTRRNAAEAAYWFRIGIAPFELASSAAAPEGDIRLRLRNGGGRALTASVRDDSYGRGERRVPLEPGETQELLWDLQHSHHWYDLTIRVGRHEWRLAGHIEDGRESISDPANVAPILT